MSSNDAEVYNLLERILSGDQNDAQSISARVLANVFKFGETLRVSGQMPEGTRNVVMGGLIGSPSGTDVSISPGVLMQNSAILPPVPGPLDSSYRLARNDIPTVVVMPLPGVDTWYLIEAQMVEVITSTQLRDIFNPGLQIFAPALVTKQVMHQIAFVVRVGGANAPAPTGGDWVPICIVKRPGGGGPTQAFEIVDVRPVADHGVRHPLRPTVGGGFIWAAPGNASVVGIEADLDGPVGPMTYSLPIPGTDLSDADHLSPTTVLAAAGWYYVYLCPWSAMKIPPTFQGGFILQRRGILVCTDVPPNGVRQPSGPIALPPPYGVVTVTEGYLVGVLLRDSVNAGWATQSSDDLKEFVLNGGVLDGKNVAFLNPPGVNNLISPGAGVLPDGMQSFDIYARYNGGAGAPTRVIVEVTDPTSGTFTFESPMGADDSVMEQYGNFRVPIQAFNGFGGGNNFRLRISLAAPAGATDVFLWLTRLHY